MASMRKIKGRYYLRIYLEKGRIKSLPTGTKNLKEANRIFKNIKEREFEVKAGLRDRLITESKPMLTECIEMYLNDCSKRLASKTVLNYTYALQHLRNAFKGVKINDIRSTDQSRLHKEFEKPKYNPTTVNINLRAIRAFFNWIVDNDLSDRIPFKIKMVKTEKENPKFLLPDELQAIYKLMDDYELKSTFRVYERTGMRLAELNNSRREGNFIIITKTKGKRERIVPLDSDIIEDYEIAKIRNFNSDYLSHQFTKYKRLAGIEGKKTFHSLRHTYAIRKWVETRDIYIVKELLGHSSVTVTEIYTNMPIEFLKDVFQKDAQLNPIISKKQILEKLGLSPIISN